MEDFNIDSGEWFPNQRVDGDPDECVAITVTDIIGDRLNINLDPDFTYAMTLRLSGSTPSTGGSDPWSGMLSAVGYGVLPMADADFTALAKGELYVSNWQNYSSQDCKTALTYAQNGARRISLNFNTVIAEAKNNCGVSMPMLWFSSFTNAPTTGILPTASGPATNHNVRVVGQHTINGIVYMIVKPWLGKEYGWGGYGLMSQNQFIICARDAFVFDTNANRFFSLLGIAVTKYPFLVDFLPQLMKNSTLPTPQPAVNKISAWAKLIEAGEGANPALNNPGNLKYSTLTASWGGTKGKQGSDGGWLCKFPTYTQGFTALYNFLTLACEGELIIAHHPCTLQDFTMRYAGNPPQGYIDRIAAGLGVLLTVDIATFL